MPAAEISRPDDPKLTEALPPLRWSAHPARERPWATAFSLFVIAATSLLAGTMLQSAGSGLLAAAILFISLHRFFFRTEYLLDNDGLTVRTSAGTKQIHWQEVQRFAHDEKGGILTRQAEPSRIDAFRGIHLLFPAESAPIVERIQEHIASSSNSGRNT